MGIINLAHGSLFMIGAYLAFLVARQWGTRWLALPVAVIVGIALGALNAAFFATSIPAPIWTRCC